MEVSSGWKDTHHLKTVKLAVRALDSVLEGRHKGLQAVDGVGELLAEGGGPVELELGVEVEDVLGHGGGLAGDGEADSLIGGRGEGEGEGGEDGGGEVHAGRFAGCFGLVWLG